jgi:hypothetical protein
MWMKIQELHGIKSLRDIQKTKPKLIAIEPKLIANPFWEPTVSTPRKNIILPESLLIDVDGC